MDHLSIKEIHERLSELGDWELHVDTITKDFSFNDFKEAMKFVNEVAQEAERQNHHPDILISYKTVRISLTTHDANGVTHEDFKLAKKIEQMV